MTRKPPYGVDFARVKRVVPLTAILSRYGLDSTLRRGASRLTGACPIHKGRNKRQFVVDPKTSTWRCFGDCDAGGGPLEFVAAMENVGIREAALRIAEWFAVPREQGAVQPKQRRRPVSGKPSHKAYVVEDRGEGEDADAFWTRIGSAWPHKDGKGINIVLQALPANGRLVLREYTDEDAKEEDEKKAGKRRK